MLQVYLVKTQDAGAWKLEVSFRNATKNRIHLQKWINSIVCNK